MVQCVYAPSGETRFIDLVKRFSAQPPKTGDPMSWKGINSAKLPEVTVGFGSEAEAKGNI